MYYIKLQLTEKGNKVCGAPTKTLEMKWEQSYEPTETDINEYIKAEFMSELVDHIISIKQDFRFLKINDYVCIMTPENKNSKILGQVTHIQDNSYGHEIIVSIVYPENIYLKDLRFNFEGFEIRGSRKNKKYIEVAPKEFVEYITKIKHISNTYKDVHDLLNYTYDWEEDVDYDCYEGRANMPIFLEPDEILEIHKILKNAKERYDILNV